jgi:hypothetical protein
MADADQPTPIVGVMGPPPLPAAKGEDDVGRKYSKLKRKWVEQEQVHHLFLLHEMAIDR